MDGSSQSCIGSGFLADVPVCPPEGVCQWKRSGRSEPAQHSWVYTEESSVEANQYNKSSVLHFNSQYKTQCYVFFQKQQFNGCEIVRS